jgi:hypothetical protein
MRLSLVFLTACLVMALQGAAHAADAGDPPKKEDVKKDDVKKDPKDMTLDECEANGICPVTRKPSKPIYHVKVGEKEYHFATREASKEFQADPAKFGYKKDEPKK